MHPRQEGKPNDATRPSETCCYGTHISDIRLFTPDHDAAGAQSEEANDRKPSRGRHMCTLWIFPERWNQCKPWMKQGIEARYLPQLCRADAKIRVGLWPGSVHFCRRRGGVAGPQSAPSVPSNFWIVVHFLPSHSIGCMRFARCQAGKLWVCPTIALFTYLNRYRRTLSR